MAVSAPVELRPPVVAEPVAPTHPELVEAAGILRKRGLNTGAYGEPGEQRCTVGALLEATGHTFSRPQYNPVSERYEQLYALVMAAVPTADATVEEYSDAVLAARGWDAADDMADMLERIAYGV